MCNLILLSHLSPCILLVALSFCVLPVSFIKTWIFYISLLFAATYNPDLFPLIHSITYLYFLIFIVNITLYSCFLFFLLLLSILSNSFFPLPFFKNFSRFFFLLFLFIQTKETLTCFFLNFIFQDIPNLNIPYPFQFFFPIPIFLVHFVILDFPKLTWSLRGLITLNLNFIYVNGIFLIFLQCFMMLTLTHFFQFTRFSNHDFPIYNNLLDFHVPCFCCFYVIIIIFLIKFVSNF